MQVQSSDLLSVLAGGQSGGKANAEVSNQAAGDFLNLLQGMQSNGVDLQSLGINPENPEIAQLLTSLKGNPQKVSPEILELVKQIKPEQEAAINMLLKQSGGSAKGLQGEVFFDGENFVDSNGLNIDPKKLKKLKNLTPVDISNVNPKEVPKAMKSGGGEDFLSNLKAMRGQQNVATVGGGKNSILKQYGSDQGQLSNQLISKTNNQSALNNTIDSISGVRTTNVMDVVPGLAAMNGGGEQQASMNMNGGETITKVIDLSSISAGNKTELISKISNYIQQNNIANGDSLEVLVKHDQIGNFKVQATKAEVGNAIELEIMTSNKTGQKFFMTNEVELVKNLNNSGIKLSNFKVVASTESFATQSDSKNSSSDSFGSDRGYQNSGQRGGHANQQDADSQKRRELWEHYKEQAAYAA